MMLAAVLVLNGCGALESVKQEVRSFLVDKQAEIYGEQFEMVSEDEMEISREQVRPEDYAYSQLSEEEQSLYLELFSILISYREDVKLTSMDPEQVDRVYQTIMMDHPELFYLDGYTITTHTIEDKTAFYTFTGQYNRTMEEKAKSEEQIKVKTGRILAEIDAEASDYEKVKYVYDHIVLNTVYDEESDDNQNIISVFLNNASVCQGYAYATQYLLKELGIPCTTVTGMAVNRDGSEVTHAWNLVRLDGLYYYVDTTWGDPIIKNGTDNSEILDDEYINYDYLNLTTERMSRDHRVESPVTLPECVSEEHYYYRVEDLLYETYDRDRIREKVKEAKEAGAEKLVMKFPDETVFQKHIDQLFEGQEIFGITPELRSVSYTADQESCLLIIYLAKN